MRFLSLAVLYLRLCACATRRSSANRQHFLSLLGFLAFECQDISDNLTLTSHSYIAACSGHGYNTMHTLPLPASQQMRGPDRGRRSPPQARGQDRRYPAAGGQRYAGDRRRRSMSPRRSPVHYNNKRMRGPDGPYDQAYVLLPCFCPAANARASPYSNTLSWNSMTKKSCAAGLGVMMTETSKQLMTATILNSTDQPHQGMVALLLFQKISVLLPPFLPLEFMQRSKASQWSTELQGLHDGIAR